MIGLQSHHRVLVLGNPAFLPWLTKENRNVSSARKTNEAVRFAQNGDFDRVIVGREFDISHWSNLAIAQVALIARGGLLVYFPKNEGDAWTFSQNLGFAFPLCRVWDTNTTFGRVIMVDFGPEYVQ